MWRGPFQPEPCAALWTVELRMEEGMERLIRAVQANREGYAIHTVSGPKSENPFYFCIYVEIKPLYIANKTLRYLYLVIKTLHIVFKQAKGRLARRLHCF